MPNSFQVYCKGIFPAFFFPGIARKKNLVPNSLSIGWWGQHPKYSRNELCQTSYHLLRRKGQYNTPPKINIEPENDGLEDDFPFQGCILRFHVNLPGCIQFSYLSEGDSISQHQIIHFFQGWLAQGRCSPEQIHILCRLADLHERQKKRRCHSGRRKEKKTWQT